MTASANDGFSLIEVLVSIFVLTVGVLASSALHLTALQTAQHAALQTHALHLAADLAESMQSSAMPLRLEDGGLVFDSGEAGEWLQRIRRELPDGRARVCRDASPWNEAGARLTWDCLPAGADGEGPLVIKIGWRDRTQADSPAADAPRVALAVRPVHP